LFSRFIKKVQEEEKGPSGNKLVLAGVVILLIVIGLLAWRKCSGRSKMFNGENLDESFDPLLVNSHGQNQRK